MIDKIEEELRIVMNSIRKYDDTDNPIELQKAYELLSAIRKLVGDELKASKARLTEG